MQGSLQRLIDMYTGDDTCLVIPVYQRNYDWKQENCLQLFNDLEEVVRENRENHFFGSIVYKDEGAIGESTIIDGQQRLTTVNLLFLALHRALVDGTIGGNPKLAGRIADSYLHSEYAASGHKLKLKPVKADSASYEKLFGDPAFFNESSRVTANYKFFLQRLAATTATGDQIFEAIRKLQVMRLKLEPGDNAQMIFESLNSTGLDLSEADMIRNFVLMGRDRATQEALYENYWNRMEESVSYATSQFIRHYLTAKLGRTPKEAELYAEFRAYLRRTGLPVDVVLAEMRSYAEHYRDLLAPATGAARVDRIMRKYNLVDRNVTMPMLLSTMDDYRNERIDRKTLERIVAAIDSYLARRWVCGYPTNALNKIFALLHREAVKTAREGDDFADVVVYLLERRQGSGTFPSDQEFLDALLTKDFYHIYAAQRNYFWESLENGTSNDVRDIAHALIQGDVSIEHVMPQTLTDDWRDELGPDAEQIHEKWLHRLGNLTVTGYNSSYSNASFISKRDREQGYRDTPYRINQQLRTADSWSAAQLEQRALELANAALDYWPTPDTNYQPAPDVRDVEPLGTDTVFTNRVIRAWEYNGAVHSVSSWKQMFIDVLTMLTEQDPTVLRQGYNWTANLRYRHSEGKPTDGWTQLGSGVEVWAGLANSYKAWILRTLFEKMGLDPDDLIFHLEPVEVVGADADDE